RVVMTALIQRLPDALDDPAMDLAFDDERVDRAPDVVHRGVAHDLHRSQIRIDLDLAHVAAVGEGSDVDGLVGKRPERTPEILGQLLELRPGPGDLEQADRASLGLAREAAVAEPALARLALEHEGGEPRALFHDLLHAAPHPHARQPQPAPAVRAAAD